MYAHILVATDGSEIANRAVKHAIQLAHTLGAKLSAVTVTEPFEAVITSGLEEAIEPGEYDKLQKAMASDLLAAVTAAAVAHDIECNEINKNFATPYEGIIAAAESIGADLIVIGSHGRSGLGALLLGSQAVKLLTHCKIPAIVVR